MRQATMRILNGKQRSESLNINKADGTTATAVVPPAFAGNMIVPSVFYL
ncbi:MAG: hypothetical protein K6A82_00650 [Prevotella sp.]|nr:hypothetical protein [Prevotella sp.]